MTLDDYTTTLWPQLDVAPRTRANYQGAYRRHLKPVLGSKPLEKVTRTHIANALAPLPSQSKYQALMTMRVVYREAVDAGLVKLNPAATIKAPRIRPKPAKFLTLDYVMTNSFGPYTDTIRFLALHGLRWGEFAALEDNDIRDGRVFVQRSLEGPTKSSAGVRSVPYLGHYPASKPCRAVLARHLRRHGVTIHSLRKTYAYGLKTSGVHVTTAAKLMGHANPMVTLSIYTKVLDNEIDDAGTQLREKYGL